MIARGQILLPAIAAFLVWPSISFAQADVAPSSQPISSGQPDALQGTPQGLQSHEYWPSPVGDKKPDNYVLFDVLEYRPRADNSDFRWDIEGWHGGDINKLWFKTEGVQTALKADYDIDAQLLYARFLHKYYDFQTGIRAEARIYRGRNVTRGQAVIGAEGLIPYKFEMESALFVSQKGEVSARFSLTRDFLITQYWVVQSRLETAIAAQRVERFSTGSGLNNIEYGLRVRYDVNRKFGPYAGISFERSFFDTARIVRQNGGDTSQMIFVVGVRMWR